MKLTIFVCVSVFCVLGAAPSCLAIEPLTERLISPNAAAAIGEIGNLDARTKQQVARELAEVMTTGYADARFRAQTALARMGTAAIDPMLDIVQKHKGLMRWNAIQVLGNIGKDAARSAPALISVLATDTDEYSRREAAQALGKMSLEASVAQAPLLRALSDSDANVRLWSVRALGSLRPSATSALPELARMAASDRDRDARAAALEVIEKVSPGSPETIAALRNALSDREFRVRYTAVLALGRAGPAARAAIGDLTAIAANDADATIKSAAVFALGELGVRTPESVSALLAALSSSDSFTRYSAVKSLHDLAPADSRVAPALIAALEDSDPHVRKWAIRALGRMGAPARSAIPVLIAKTGGSDPEQRSLAIAALGPLGRYDAPRVVPVLLGIVEKAEMTPRLEAFAALRQIEPLPDQAIPVLLRQLDLDEHLGQNLEAATVLATMGPRAVPALVNALRSDNERRRFGAALALKYMGRNARDAAAALTAALNDPSQRVRGAAREALDAAR